MDGPDKPRLEVVESFKQRLLEAPEPRRGRRIGRLPLPAALGLVLVALAVPAWATGLLERVFPQDELRPHSNDPYGGGDRLVLKTGPLPGGRSYRLIGFNSALPAIANPRPGRLVPLERGICVELQLRPRPPGGAVDGQVASSCITRRELAGKVRLGDGGTRAFGKRRPYYGILPTSVAVIHVTFRSGDHLDVRPNAPSPRRLRESGLRFPFRYVAFIAPPGDRYAGMTVEDVNGRIVQRDRLPTPTPPGTPVRNSPAL